METKPETKQETKPKTKPESEQQIHICPSCRSLDSQELDTECWHGCEGIQAGASSQARPKTSGQQDKSRSQAPASASRASKGRFGDDEPPWQRPTYPGDRRDSASPIRPGSQQGKPSQLDDTTLGGGTDADESGKGPTTADESSLGGPTDADEKSKQGSQGQQPRRSAPSPDASGRQTTSPTRGSSAGPGSPVQGKTSRSYDPALRQITGTPDSFERVPSSATSKPDNKKDRGSADSKVESRHISLPSTDTARSESGSPRPTGRQTGQQKKTLPGDTSPTRGTLAGDNPSMGGSENVDSSGSPGKPSVRRTMPSTTGRQTASSTKTPANTAEDGPEDEEDPLKKQPEEKGKKGKRGSKASQDTSGTGRRSSSAKKKSLRGTTSPVPSPHNVQQ